MIILVIIILVLILFLRFRNKKDPDPLKWEYPYYLEELIKKFGEPVILLPEKGGYAVFRKSCSAGDFKSCSAGDFKSCSAGDFKIKLYDSKETRIQIVIPYKIEETVLLQTLMVSDKLVYDPLKKELSVESYSWESCYCILNLATTVGNRILSIEHVVYNKILEQELKEIFPPTLIIGPETTELTEIDIKRKIYSDSIKRIENSLFKNLINR